MIHTVRKSRLSNGIQVLTIHRPYLSRENLTILIGAGASHEPAGKRGVAHLVEHMIFRGNEEVESQNEQLSILDDLGVDSNAFTAHAFSGFIATMPPESVEAACVEIERMISTMTFTDLEIEKLVVAQEASASVDDSGKPLYPVHRVIQMAFGPEQGCIVSGLPSEIFSLEPEDLEAYHKRFYVAKNIAIAIAGPLEHDKAMSALEAFSKIKSGDVALTVKPPPVQTSANIEDHLDLLPKPSIKIGIVGPRFDNQEERYLTVALMYLLSGDVMSRTWNEFRGEEGVAYNVGCTMEQVGVNIFLMLHAASDEDSTPRAMEKLLKLIDSTIKDPMTENEISRFRKKIRRDVVAMEDSLSTLVDVYLSQLIFGSNATLEDHVKNIDMITPEKIQDHARKLFAKHKLNIVVSGVKDEECRTETRAIIDRWVNG